MDKINLEAIKKQAMAELEQERFQLAVAEYKAKLKRRTWWDFVFPWRIVFIKKEKL